MKYAVAYLRRVMPDSPDYHPVKAQRIYARHWRAIEQLSKALRDEHRREIARRLMA